MFGPPVPIFRIFDEALAIQHYCDYLGCSRDWEHRFGPDFPIYLQVRLEQLVLHLSEHGGDCTPGARIRVQVEDLRAFHGRLSAKSYRLAKPGLQDTPWGDWEMTVGDPFGNRITFYQAKPDSES